MINPVCIIHVEEKITIARDRYQFNPKPSPLHSLANTVTIARLAYQPFSILSLSPIKARPYYRRKMKRTGVRHSCFLREGNVKGTQTFLSEKKHAWVLNDPVSISGPPGYPASCFWGRRGACIPTDRLEIVVRPCLRQECLSPSIRCHSVACSRKTLRAATVPRNTKY